jgi:hypothetical protein
MTLEREAWNVMLEPLIVEHDSTAAFLSRSMFHVPAYHAFAYIMFRMAIQ